MTARPIPNPDSIDWSDTRRPEVRQAAILDALEALFAAPPNNLVKLQKARADREWEG